jgi:energy-coupling factor transporter ATP-binding protein EcfA2
MIYRVTFLYIVKSQRLKQASNIRFLQVKIPKKERENAGDAENVQQSMKQNIEVMNQFYKNFYAIFNDSWFYKTFWNNYISIEMFIEKEMIKFILGVPEAFVDNVEKMVSSFYIGSVIEFITQPKMLEAGKFMAWGEFLLKKNNVYPIKTYESYEADPMDSLLGSYSKVTVDEKINLQILISPLADSWLKKLRKKTEKVKEWKDRSILQNMWHWIWDLLTGKDKKKDWENEAVKHDFSQNQLGDFDKKLDDELFQVKIRALVISPEEMRVNKILDDLARSFNQYNYAWLNAMKFEQISKKDISLFAQEFIDRVFFSDKWLFHNLVHYNDKMILNIKELSSIIHFPTFKFNKNPRISRQKYKIVPAPDNMPIEGMHIGYNTYGWVKKKVNLQFKDRFRHVYVIGQTGTGKTTLLYQMAIEDIKNGNGICYIDPHGDVAEQLLQHIPKERIDDLIYFDLSNTEYPIAFNPLHADNDDEMDVVTNDLIEMFVSMYGHEIFWPRIQDYFRNACFLLMEQPEWGTLVDIMRLFTDAAFAETKIRNLKNPVIASRWNKTYRAMGDREKAEIIPFIQAKFAPFTTGVYIRNIIGQLDSSFNFYDAMNQNKIIICNLSKWLAGEINSQLIGRMVAMQIKISALKRAAMTESDRKPFFLYVDEFQNYVSKSFESILSEARKYRLGLAVAHQYIDQLREAGLWGEVDLSKTIFGNVGTIFALKVGAPDAEFLENEFSPEFSKQDLVSMDQFMGIMKMSINSQQSKPFTFKPLNPYEIPPINTPEKLAIIKQISALKRGVKRELVDKEIFYRIGV